MNYLMKFGFCRLIITLLSFGNLILVYLIVKSEDYVLFTDILNPVNLAYSVACVILILLSVYYIVKIIWRDKYLNFNPNSTWSKLAAIAIMFTAGFSSIFILKTFKMSANVYVAYLTGLYMVIVAFIPAVFISRVKVGDDKIPKISKNS